MKLLWCLESLPLFLMVVIISIKMQNDRVTENQIVTPSPTSAI